MNIPKGFGIRRASIDDVSTIVEHRRSMFHDMGYHNEAALDSVATKFRPWLLARMKSDEYRAWLVVATNGSVAAGAGL